MLLCLFCKQVFQSRGGLAVALLQGVGIDVHCGRGLSVAYHWVILAILFSEMIIYGGIGNSIGVFTIPIVEDLGIGRGAYSLTASVKALVGAASTMLAASAIGNRRC